uniref:Demeter RRM-fold domain-containing protein n=2 Tax=Oryza brachyantha TaxID=4533 RepID=J3LD11_ORYBR
MSPATPDIGRKPAARRAKAGASGSSRSSVSAATPDWRFGVVKVGGGDLGSAPSVAGERPQAEGKAREEECASSTQESTVSPPVSRCCDGTAQQESNTQDSAASPPLVTECGDKNAQQESSTQESTTSPLISECGDKVTQQEGAASVIPTPEKVEDTPWRPRKRSKKGMTRLKVFKDESMKRGGRATPRTVTPVKTKTKRKAKENARQPRYVSGGKSARRKLDFEDDRVTVEGDREFSRAQLMEDLRCLAKVHGLCNDLGAGNGSKKGRKRKKMSGEHQDNGELAIVPFQKTPAAASSSELVPIQNSTELAIVNHKNHMKNLRAKVLGLDEKTLQVYDVLRKWDETDSESFEGLDIGSGPEWDETRRYFEHCVDVFIATVHGLLGPRRFSEWGGSVMDSVVGTFLTQNVADNLSSTAFMNLAAKFPPTKRHINAEVCSNLSPLIDDMRRKLNLNEQSNGTDSGNSGFTKPDNFEKENGYNKELKGNYGRDYKMVIENFITIMKKHKHKDISTWDNERLKNMVKNKSGTPVCSINTLKKFIATLKQEDTSHWDKLRVEAYSKGYNNMKGTRTSDSVDWEAVLCAPEVEVAKCIAERGQHYVMALRIQAFLMRVKKDHGTFDLDWLRYVPRESAKNYLLSVLGLGDKSVDCIRLLSLKHKAFPVDVNVARIVTRLGWVKLQPLPFSAEFHLVGLYPIMRDVQKYLWPRLCTISKEKLYELHCLMITFGKTICTKVSPNCSACPFSAKCKYYNSSLARASLPPAEEHAHEHGEDQASTVTPGSLLLSNVSHIPGSPYVWHPQIEISMPAGRESICNSEPIIEMPLSPEYEYGESPNEQEPYEDDLCDIEDIIPEIPYDIEVDLLKHMINNGSWTPNSGKDLALVNPRHASVQNRRLRNTGRLRTEHNAYVLPDDHAILEEFEERVPEDPCPYLLIVISCPDEYTVKGTILIPCRTATRGKFPLNGTYFQDHEVFADNSSSHCPITIPRECIWNLDRCIVYFGSSIHSITRGQTKEDIQDCFKKGYICVRGFDRNTRYPKPLCTTLHATRERNKAGENSRKRTKTSQEGKIDDKSSSAEK